MTRGGSYGLGKMSSSHILTYYLDFHFDTEEYHGTPHMEPVKILTEYHRNAIVLVLKHVLIFGFKTREPDCSVFYY